MTTQFEPVPSFAPVILFDERAQDVAALIRSAKFNPIWLHWFLRAANFITNSGGGGGGAADHNSLAGLQGGQASEYYHATSADYTGTGTGVFARKTSPALITPSLGVATATSINKVAITAPATSATLTIADGASLVTSGAYSLTLISTAATNVTFPTTGTLATLAGVEELDNKTLDSSVGKGTWTASGTWTLPALTLGGTITATTLAGVGTRNVVVDTDGVMSAP